jgi:hypothetical protein
MAQKISFVIRSYNNDDLDTAVDIVAANRISRRFSQHTKVYKQTPEGETPMSYTGPRDNNLK